MHAAELESKFAEMGGYDAEARAGELLLGAGHPGDTARRPDEREWRRAGSCACCWRRCCSPIRTSCCSTSRPTTWTSTPSAGSRSVLNERNSTMIIISHDRHFLNAVCTHMADLDYGTLRVYPGSYDDYMEASTLARERLLAANAKAKERIAELQEFVRRFSRQQVQGAPGHQPHEADREDQGRGRQAVQPPVSVDPLRLRRQGQAAPAWRWRSRICSFGYDPARR